MSVEEKGPFSLFLTSQENRDLFEHGHTPDEKARHHARLPPSAVAPTARGGGHFP
jgi:hypothetical protein